MPFRFAEEVYSLWWCRTEENMQGMSSEEDFTLSFGYQQGNASSRAPFRLIVDMGNTNRSVMDPKTVRQCKADQARILEQFNSPYYSLLVAFAFVCDSL